MIDTLNIGQVIYNALSSDDDITGYVGANIFPVVATFRSDAEFNSLMPFIVYQREGMTGRSTKDGVYEDSAQVSIKIVTSNYIQGVELATLVRKLFEDRKIQYENITMCDTQLQNAYEEYNDNYSAYVQTIKLNTKIS